MKFRVALLAVSVLSAPAAALAQPVTGPYISLGAGLEYLIDQNIQTDPYYTGGVSKISNNVGGVASASLGYGLGNGIRLELQGDWGGTRVDVGESTTSNY
jgi:OOP family OmpA-OmpF porin